MIIKNNLIPLKGFTAMALWPFVFVRKEWIKKMLPDTGASLLTTTLKKSRYDRMLRHELIHHAQQVEVMALSAILLLLLILFFDLSFWWLTPAIVVYYLLYFFMWLWGELWSFEDPYRMIPFEKESYDNQKDLEYLKERKFFAWLKYL